MTAVSPSSSTLNCPGTGEGLSIKLWEMLFEFRDPVGVAALPEPDTMVRKDWHLTALDTKTSVSSALLKIVPNMMSIE